MRSDLDHRCAIGIMAKAPQAGRCKTRLCPPLTPEQAATLSAAFLRDTTATIAAAGREAAIAGYAAYAPRGAEAALLPCLEPGTSCVLADGAIEAPPGVEGFGRCLLHAVEEMLGRGHEAACVLSADTPTLPIASLVTAARLLLAGDARRVVLGACDDGGYYLLGMSAAHAGLFTNIAWSTETVGNATRERARELGLELIELPPWYDVDDAVSLRRLVGEADGRAAPHTHAAIVALGLTALLAPQAA